MAPTVSVTPCWLLALIPVFWLTVIMPAPLPNDPPEMTLPLYESAIPAWEKLTVLLATVELSTEAFTVPFSENELALVKPLLLLLIVLVVVATLWLSFVDVLWLSVVDVSWL